MTKKKSKKPVTPVKDSAIPSTAEPNGPVTNASVSQYRFGDIFESDNNDEEALLDAKLSALGLARKRIPKDGACLFRAVAEQLYYTQTMHHNVRKKCVDYIEKHKDMYEPFVCVGGEMPYDHYCFEMRKSNTWGGEIEISAMHYTFGLDFEIFSPSHQEPTRVGDGKHQRIKLGFYGNHYDCVYPQSSVDAEQFCQGIVYDLLDKALGVKLPRESKFKNVGLECWRSELEEQQLRDENMAVQLADTEHMASSQLSGFSKKSPEAVNGWQVKNRRQPTKAHTADDASPPHAALGSSKRPDSKPKVANGKPGIRSSKDELEEAQFMQAALRAVAEQEQADKREKSERERVLMMRDQANFPSLAPSSKPAWKPLPVQSAAAPAVPPADSASAPASAVAQSAAPVVPSPAAPAAPGAPAAVSPSDKKEPSAGVWSTQPRNWSAVFAKPVGGSAPAAYRPPMTAASESSGAAAAPTEVVSADGATAAAQPSPIEAVLPRLLDSVGAAQPAAIDVAAGRDSNAFYRVESLKEVIVDPFTPPFGRKKAPSPVTDDPAIVRVLSAADAAANLSGLQRFDESSPVRFAFDRNAAPPAGNFEAARTTPPPPMDRVPPRSASNNDFQIPEADRSPVRLSDLLLVSFGKMAPPPPTLIVGTFRIVPAVVWPFKRTPASEEQPTSSSWSSVVPAVATPAETETPTTFDVDSHADSFPDAADTALASVTEFDGSEASVPVARTPSLNALSPSFELSLDHPYQQPVMHFPMAQESELDPNMPYHQDYEGGDSRESFAVADAYYRNTAPRAAADFRQPRPYDGGSRHFVTGVPNGFAGAYPMYPQYAAPMMYVDPMNPMSPMYYTGPAFPQHQYPPMYNPTFVNAPSPQLSQKKFMRNHKNF
eukprot:TRINITY_DN7329_c0_g1_i1.p1 TRINITY_DN7329_c0_g1~~TRINITY_DN7329_c0_g1_i1.p1  ORF type:complete len:886 (+),score=175.53 TRINITY_DN7329_c0_g1_i1:136-2793(+)